MQLVTRNQLGWPASAAADQPTTLGVKIHYEGTEVSAALLADHNLCVAEWRAIRASHLANTAEGYVDVAYNFAACVHGVLFEGRGLRKRSGANGNRTLNEGHYAVVGLLGDSGVTEPTEAMLHALRDGIELLRANGAGLEVKGHRDGYATSCPGRALYAWVQAGAPRPGAPVPSVPSVPPVHAAPRFPGRYMAVQSPMLHGDDVRDFQRRMSERGWPLEVDGWYGPASAGIVRLFQLEKMIVADSVVGPVTWDAAFRTDNIT